MFDDFLNSDYIPFKIKKISMVQDDIEAFIFNANFDNDFKTDYNSEF